MSRFWALLVTLLLVAVPLTAFSQTASPPAVTPRATPNPSASASAPTELDARELAMVRTAVKNVGDSYRRSRTSDGVGSIIGGALIGGLGMYLYIGESDPQIRLIGVAMAFSAVPPIIAGMWNIFYNTSQEDMATKLLGDDKLLDGGGLLFVEQEARRARRGRLVGGTTQIAAGGATLASYFLLKEFFIAGPDNILLIFFAVGTAVQVISGVIQLVGKSGPEKAYAELLQGLGRSPEPSGGQKNQMSRLQLAPLLFGNDGKVAPGLGLSFGF